MRSLKDVILRIMYGVHSLILDISLKRSNRVSLTFTDFPSLCRMRFFMSSETEQSPPFQIRKNIANSIDIPLYLHVYNRRHHLLLPTCRIVLALMRLSTSSINMMSGKERHDASIMLPLHTAAELCFGLVLLIVKEELTGIFDCDHLSSE